MAHPWSSVARQCIVAAERAAAYVAGLPPGHRTVDAQWVVARHTGLVRHDLIGEIRKRATASCLERMTPDGGVASKYGGDAPSVIATALALEHLPAPEASAAAAWLRGRQSGDGSWAEDARLPWPAARPWYASSAGKPWVTATVISLLRLRPDCGEEMAREWTG